MPSKDPIKLDIDFKPIPEPYILDNYEPSEDEHVLVNKFAHLRKLLAGFLLDSYAIETEKWDEDRCVVDNAGLYYTNGMYEGAMTVEMVDECFRAVRQPQPQNLIERFVSSFNRFTDIEGLEVNNNLIAMLLTFMRHEVGGLNSRKEIKSGNQPYWKPTGPYG